MRSSRIYPEFGLPRPVGRELRITSVFSCVARGFKPRASFRFTGCCWWRPLTVDGGSGTSGGHAWSAPEMRGPGADFRVTARTMQGMARVRSGQAPAWPLSSGRSVRRGSGVKRDFACTFTRRFSPVLVARRSQSRLMLEGRARTLSGPSPDLSQATTLPPSGRSEDLQIRRYPRLRVTASSAGSRRLCSWNLGWWLGGQCIRSGRGLRSGRRIDEPVQPRSGDAAHQRGHDE